MSTWAFWDWVGFGCLGIAAVGLALGALGKENPKLFSWLPRIFANSRLGYLPIVLFALGSMIFDHSCDVSHGRRKAR
jgi:hypothetical protein